MERGGKGKTYCEVLLERGGKVDLLRGTAGKRGKDETTERKLHVRLIVRYCWKEGENLRLILRYY